MGINITSLELNLQKYYLDNYKITGSLWAMPIFYFNKQYMNQLL